MNKIVLFIILSGFCRVECPAIDIKGRITDTDGAPVAGADVFFKASDNLAFLAKSDAGGYYVIDDQTLSVKEQESNVSGFFCYPNPANRQTVLSFSLKNRQRAEVAVYDKTGVKISVVADRIFERGLNEIVWDGLMYSGQPAVPGLYICSLQTADSHESIKLIVTGGVNIATPVSADFTFTHSAKKSLKDAPGVFSATVSGPGFPAHKVEGIEVNGALEKNFIIHRATWAPFGTAGKYLGTYDGEGYKPFFIKGVNMGGGVPGSFPGQMAVSGEQYARWFGMIAAAGFNTIRIYTLHFPRFYEELVKYNTVHPDKPLYLLHGVWLPEEYDGEGEEYGNLFTKTAFFQKACRDAVDCVHGKNTIPFRYGEAFGVYSADVSPWTLGWLTGREVYAEEVDITNLAHPEITDYDGVHFSIPAAAQASEVWVVEQMDVMITYERTHYHTERPIAFSSWATLDPLTHPSQTFGLFEDSNWLDLNNVVEEDAPAGHYISYHAYPYYPYFINHDDAYRDETDDYGANPYKAYIRDLRDHYTNYPVLIAEFGLPTSWGIARFAPSGMHHGGMTDEQQGNYMVRLYHNVYDDDCAGGVAFAWMDEWFKTTWITQPLTSERRHLWHNLASPENNFGFLRYVPNPAYYTVDKRQSANVSLGKVNKGTVWHDFRNFNIETTLNAPLSAGDTLWTGVDTYLRNAGESTLPNGFRAFDDNRAEFLLRITADSVQYYVTEAYNTQGLIHQNCFSPAFQTKVSDGKPWMPYRWQNDETYITPNIQETGKFAIYRGVGTPDAQQAVTMNGNTISIRIPWTFLQFTDPSKQQVVDDAESPAYCLANWGCNMRFLNHVTSEGIALTLVCNNAIAKLPVYTWESWDVGYAKIAEKGLDHPENLNFPYPALPGYQETDLLDANLYIEEAKASLSILSNHFKSFPFTPK